MPTKADGAAIVAFLGSLASEVRLDGSRKWWPKYIYRSEHVEAAAAILRDGELLSRAAAEAQGKMVKDCASPGLIASLTPAEKRWVRLYFRPRAPTQYRNEGIRPTHKYEYDSHMPVPVYLLFRSGPLLATPGVTFTRGRLRRRSPTGTDVEFLKSIPFKDVYHDSGTGQRTAEIVDARHAEVLVRQRLPLDHLRYVVCRSAPERDTLLSLLDGGTRETWEGAVILEGGRRFFYKRGTFVQAVELTSTRSRFTFYPHTEGLDWRGPFDLQIRWQGGDGWNASWRSSSYTISDKRLAIDLKGHRSPYVVRVTMNGDLAYQGAYRQPTEPEVLF